MALAMTRLEALEKPSHREWLDLGRQIDAGLVATLRSLTEEEWSAPTECHPWTVKDMVGHLIGWDEATVSPIELGRQAIGGWRTRKGHGNSWLDATNQYQVDANASGSTTEVLARFEELLPRYHKIRSRYGLMTGIFPMKEPFSGTWVPVRFMFDTIFVRDHFMHHLDICRAIGRDVPVTDAERRVAHDAFREWGDKAKASVTLDLTGPAGGTFVRGSGDTLIRSDALDLCRVLAGRSGGPLEIEGDEEAAKRWLGVLAAF